MRSNTAIVIVIVVNVHYRCCMRSDTVTVIVVQLRCCMRSNTA